MDLLLKQVMFDPGVPLGSLNKTLKTVDDFSPSTDWCGVGFFKKLKQLAGDSLELCLKKSQHIFKKYQLSPKKKKRPKMISPIRHG